MAVDRLIWKIVLDFFVLLCVGFPLLAIMLWVKPYERGYFADDTSIRLPFKEQLISVGALAGAGFGFMIVTVLIVEIIRDRKGKGSGEKFLSGAVMPGWVWESYQTIGVFTFGAACQQLTSDLGKYVIGRLRPHFIEVCRPFPVLNSEQNRLGYIQDYICAENDEGRIKEARLSFPSAHSSFAMYCAVFFIFYIQVKGKWRGSKLLRHGMQYAVMLTAWYVGLSRVQDNMHHWSDVTVGFIIGATYACVVFVYVLKPKTYSDLPMNWDQDPDNDVVAPPNTLPRVALSR